MLPITKVGRGEPVLVLLPFLGGTQREWTELVAILSTTCQCITVDLPGFGDANAIGGYSVSEMSDSLIETLASLNLERYVLVGHSMAGKVSAVAARRMAEAARTAESHLTFTPPMALVLVAPSPPGPEPMTDEKRSEMLNALGDLRQRQQGSYSDQDLDAGAKYINDNNHAQAIPKSIVDRTVSDVLTMNPEAWSAWLKSGSKEDWSEFVGVLDLPTLIIAGTNDQALGPDSQRLYTLPHFNHGIVQQIDSGHLVPLERPVELAAMIMSFIASAYRNAPSLRDEYMALIESPRVSPQTREVLLGRGAADDPNYLPQALTSDELLTLRHVTSRIVPQQASKPHTGVISGQTGLTIDIAARMDKQLAEATSDGWRYATLPSDLEACRTGLALLDEFATKLSAVPFARLLPQAQDSLLAAIAAGRLHSAKLDLRRWFEDLSATAVQIYVSHPDTLAGLGYSGVADDPSGFVQIGMGERETWEPLGTLDRQQ